MTNFTHVARPWLTVACMLTTALAICGACLPSSVMAGEACYVRVSAFLNPGSEVAKNIITIQELERIQAQFLLQVQQGITSMPPSADSEQIQQTVAKLEAEIRAQQENQTTPPICPLGFEVNQRYVQEVVARIEDCGTRFFPKENGKKLYGKAKGTFTLDRDGTLVNKKIDETSGNERLDAYFLEMIARSAPFGPVPATLHADQYERFVYSTRFETLRSKGKAAKPQQGCRLK